MFCIDSVDIDSIECIRDPCPVSRVLTYIVLIVWLKSTQSQLSKTFCRLNALKILIPYVDSVNIYSISGHCIQNRVFIPHYSVYSVV